MSVEIRNERFRSVVGDAPEIERIATGFLFTEGPLWHARDEYLLFSDMPGDHLRKWSRQSGVTTFRKPCAQSNGLAWDRQGRLVVCEHATSRLTRTEADGRSTTLASHRDGKELNSPNDVVVKSDGAIYFSDPTYGRMPGFGVEREPEQPVQGVYRLPPGGRPDAHLDAWLARASRCRIPAMLDCHAPSAATATRSWLLSTSACPTANLKASTPRSG